MENVLLEEKSSYARKILPAKRGRFSCVKEIEVAYKVDDEEGIHKTKKEPKKRALLLLLSVILFLSMMFMGCKWLLAANSTISSQLVNVIGNLFTPKDFGKIKFVDTGANTIDAEAIASFEAFELPFVACVATKVGDNFLLESAGEITIKAAMQGVVESIETNPETFKKTVTVAHKFNIKSVYYLMDTVTVKVGDKVEKNTILGITMDGKIGLSVIYNGKNMKGLEIVDGEMTFS